MTDVSRIGDTSSGGRQIAVVNGLRGLAIITVVCTHLWLKDIADIGSFMAEGINISPLGFVPDASHFMALFFMLSGFVLYLPYVNGKRTMRSRADAWEFYVRRARRLLPLYFFSVIIGLSFSPHAGPLLSKFLIFGTATFNFFKDLYFPPHNGPLWSIGIEIWACMLLPLLMIGARKFGIMRIFYAVLVLGIGTRVTGLFFPSLDIAWGMNIVIDSVLARLDDFAWGMLLAHLYVHHASVLSKAWLPIGIVGIFLASNITTNWDMGILTVEIRPLINILISLSIFLLFGGLLSLTKGWLHAAITCKPLQMLGMMCYSLYIWHYMLINPLRATLDPLHFVRYVLILLLLSALSYRYLEFGHVRDIRKLLPQK